MSPEDRSNEDAAQLIAAHDANPPQGPWDECDGCHVEYVRSLLARIAAVEADNESLRRINDASEWRPRLVELRAELDAMTRYAAALTRGLSDYEARAEGWPDAALAASPTRERCGEFGIELWEMRCEYAPGGRHTHYPTVAASPTPTGQEPEAPCTAPAPSEFEPWAFRCEFPAGHDGPHRDGPHEWQARPAGPATPTEPTEETP